MNSLMKSEKLLYVKDKWDEKTHILIEDVTHIYKTHEIELIALEHINLKISHGEFVGIMGPSGSGKSTLIKTLVGLIKPTLGSIYFKPNNGKIVDISNLQLDDLAVFRLNYFGYIQQHISLFNDLTALENVMLPKIIQIEQQASKENRNVQESEIQTQAEQTLGFVNMTQRKYHKIYEMSGGEQQRIAISAALMKNPEIIFADEPTGELDSTNSNNIFSIFRDISKKKNITVICVTHNDIIKNYCDRIVKISDGKILL